MGWSRGYHAYVFEDPRDGAVLGPKKYAGGIDMMHAPMKYAYVMDDRQVPLCAILDKVGGSIFYTYDLGDDWRHRIELLSVSKEGQSDVVLIDGRGACPPEDGNGLDKMDYGSFLQEYKRNPKSSKMKVALRAVESQAVNYSKPWMGGPPQKFKPLEFDINRHRLSLAAMLAGPQLKHIQHNGQRRLGDGNYKHCYRACIFCGDRIKAMMKCGQCGTWYCSRKCQVDDWKKHKKTCKGPAKKQKKKESTCN